MRLEAREIAPSSSSHRKTAYTTREMARNSRSVSAQFHETHAYHTCTKIDPFWLNLHLNVAYGDPIFYLLLRHHFWNM